jgi:DNA primase
LYGLNWSKAAIRREGTALVVEGYMDYVALAGRGIDHVVAPLGTAMTTQQANLLGRYTGKALLLYDSDTAGLKASFRTADVLLDAGVHPLVVSLPAGDDPDDIVRRGGADALKVHLDAAQDVIERKLEMLEQRGFFNDIDGVRRALDRLLPTLRATRDPALRDIYTARVAQRTGVRRETLERDLDRADAGPPEPRRAPPRRVQHEPRRQEWAAERLLLTVLITDRARIVEAQQLVAVDDLHDPRHREIYRALGGQIDDDVPRLSTAANALYEELRARNVEIMDADRSFESAVADIQLEGLSVRHKFLDDQLNGAADDSQKAAIAMEKFELKREVGRLTQRATLGFKASRRYRDLLSNRRSANESPNP